MIEDDLEKSQERLRVTTQKLDEAHQATDESERLVFRASTLLRSTMIMFD